jgi:hypothetical protein
LHAAPSGKCDAPSPPLAVATAGQQDATPARRDLPTLPDHLVIGDLR